MSPACRRNFVDGATPGLKTDQIRGMINNSVDRSATYGRCAELPTITRIEIISLSSLKYASAQVWLTATVISIHTPLNSTPSEHGGTCTRVSQTNCTLSSEFGDLSPEIPPSGSRVQCKIQWISSNTLE